MSKFIVEPNIYGHFYPENLANDHLVLVKYDNQKLTTGEAKSLSFKIIGCIKDALTLMTVVDERYQRYETTLLVVQALNFLLNRKQIKNPEKEAIKIAIDVIVEMGVLSTESPFGKNSIRLISALCKLGIDRSGE